LAFDHPCRLHLFYAPPANTRTDTAPFGKFGRCQAWLRLKMAQYPPINIIKHDFFTIPIFEELFFIFFTNTQSQPYRQYQRLKLKAQQSKLKGPAKCASITIAIATLT
jgi:hypothetical protein